MRLIKRGKKGSKEPPISHYYGVGVDPSLSEKERG